MKIHSLFHIKNVERYCIILNRTICMIKIYTSPSCSSCKKAKDPRLQRSRFYSLFRSRYDPGRSGEKALGKEGSAALRGKL